MFDEWHSMTLEELMEVKRELIKANKNEQMLMAAEPKPYGAYLHARNIGGYEYKLAYIGELIQEARECPRPRQFRSWGFSCRNSGRTPGSRH